MWNRHLFIYSPQRSHTFSLLDFHATAETTPENNPTAVCITKRNAGPTAVCTSQRPPGYEKVHVKSLMHGPFYCLNIAQHING